MKSFQIIIRNIYITQPNLMKVGTPNQGRSFGLNIGAALEMWQFQNIGAAAAVLPHLELRLCFGVMLLPQQLLDYLCVVSICWCMKWYYLFKTFKTMISGHLTYCLMSISRYIIVKFGHDSKWVAILRKLLLPSQLLVLIYYFTVRAIVDKYVRSLNGTQEVNNFQKDILQYICKQN